jgi:hypothetical protein
MIHRYFPWLAILCVAIILFADYLGIAQAWVVGVWRLRHQVEESNQIVFGSKLKEYEASRRIDSDALRECPDTMSCPDDEEPVVDRCCSPAMGLLVFVQQVNRKRSTLETCIINLYINVYTSTYSGV